MSAGVAPDVRVPMVDRWWARFMVPAVLPVVLVVGYQRLASSGANPYFPTLPSIAGAARELWFGAGLTRDVLPSLTNLAIGYLTGLLLGTALGVLLGRIEVARRLVSPLIAFGLTLPTVALLPLFLIVFGIGAEMQQAVIAFAVFFVAVVNTTDGVRNTDPVLLDYARVYRLTRWRRIALVVLPASAPNILAAARVGLAAGLLVMVVGEMVGAPHGIGAVTLLAQQDFAYDQMWAGIVLVGLLGIVINVGFLALERRLSTRLGSPDTGSNP